MNYEDMQIDVEQHTEVKAAIGDVFKGVLHRLGEGNTNPDGQSLQMILEQWPAGVGSAIAVTASVTCGATYR
jgi:hypothetical protein